MVKITKENKEKGIEEGYYKPDKEEQELLCEISDKVIDLIDTYNLDEHQKMFLLSALVDTHKELSGILNLEFNED